MRRAQLLSMDALLSIVLVIMIVGVVLNTNDMIKAEITNVIDWYDRANIADSMLDVLVKSPGEPANWEENPASVRIVGIRDSNRTYAASYAKLMELNSSRALLAPKLLNLARNKDFYMKVFVSEYRVAINGTFPRVYLDRVTFANPKGNPPGINFEISGGNGNTAYDVSYVEIIRGGSSYINDEICSLKNGNNIVLQDGDEVKFILAQDVTLTAKRGQYTETYTIPSGALVDVYITGPEISNFQINFGGGSCPNSFKFSGKGNVVVTVSAADTSIPDLIGNYTPAPIFENLDRPTYEFAVINGSLVTDNTVISSSMNSSPWIEVESRVFVVGRLEYNLSMDASPRLPMIYGALSQSIPVGASFKVTVPDDGGSVEFLSVSGSQRRGLFIYKDSPGENLKGVLVYDNETLVYSGNLTAIAIPLEGLFGTPEIGETIGLWFYSVSGWAREDVSIEIVPDIRWNLKPKYDAGIIKLWVWDDS